MISNDILHAVTKMEKTSPNANDSRTIKRG